MARSLSARGIGYPWKGNWNWNKSRNSPRFLYIPRTHRPSGPPSLFLSSSTTWCFSQNGGCSVSSLSPSHGRKHTGTHWVWAKLCWNKYKVLYCPGKAWIGVKRLCSRHIRPPKWPRSHQLGVLLLLPFPLSRASQPPFWRRVPTSCCYYRSSFWPFKDNPPLIREADP